MIRQARAISLEISQRRALPGLLALALVAVTARAAAPDASVDPVVVMKEATGEAAVVNGDEVKAVEDAKQAALRSAVEAAAGVRIDADTEVVNNQLVRDQVFANTSGYVKRFEILARSVDAKRKIASVTVKAEVITEHLDRDIQAARDLVRRAGRPSLIILVNEQTLQLAGPGGASAVTTSDTMASVLTKRFRDDGWMMKDPAFANGKVRVAAGASLGAAEAKELGDISKAAYILYGSATIRNQDFPTKDAQGRPMMFMVTGEYDLSLFATDVGTQVGKFSGKLTFNQQTDAAKVKVLLSYERTAFDLIQARADEIAAPVRRAVLEHLRSRQVDGASLEVSAAGLESFGAAGQLQRSLEAMAGVKGIDRLEYAQGKLLLRVVYRGSANEFAEAAERVSFKKKALEVTGVSASRVELRVAK